MAIVSRNLNVACHASVLLFLIFTVLLLKSSAVDVTRSYPAALADLKDVIVKGLGLHTGNFVVTGFDPRDALVGHSVSYEIDVAVDDKVFPVKLLEDVNRWEYVDHPILRTQGDEPEVGVVESQGSSGSFPVIAPFQLAGPMEIWVQDAQDMRLALPHDVDAGLLKKVILSDGAVVTVGGARSISLRHPIELPLPLNRTQGSIASGLLALAEHLRQVSLIPGSPPLSIRIVGPTSLTSPTSSETSSANKLKLKRLAPGLVELSSPTKPDSTDSFSTMNPKQATAILTPNHVRTMWPLVSLNASNSNLIGFEKLLAAVLGSKGNKRGVVRLLKAEVSAHTFMKIGFGVEKRLKEGDQELQRYPEWMTKPEAVRMDFEVLAKVDGKKIVPERVKQLDPLIVEHTIARNELLGNLTISTIPLIHPPPSPFSL